MAVDDGNGSDHFDGMNLGTRSKETPNKSGRVTDKKA